MRRAFLALDLPEAVEQALRMQHFLLPLPRRVHSFHLTLAFLGEQPEAVLRAAHEALCDLRIAPFSLFLQGLGLFGGTRPRAAWAGVAPSDALTHLQTRAETAIRRSGCPVAARRFVPHVTLGRFPPPKGADLMRLERAVAAGQGFATAPFEVAEMVLYESHLAAKGPRYHALARYPFNA